MDNQTQRMIFIAFLKRLADGSTARDDWGQLVIAHYADEHLEQIRRQLVQLAIKRELLEEPSWSSSDRAQFRAWSEQLSDPQ